MQPRDSLVLAILTLGSLVTPTFMKCAAKKKKKFNKVKKKTSKMKV